MFAGPAASLLGALCLWAVCLHLRDTARDTWWHSLAILTSLFIADFMVNLIPLGYSDGTMLWHLALWTEKGRHLYSRMKSTTASDDAGQEHRQFDFAAEVVLRSAALEELLASSSGSSPDVGMAYQALGWAQYHLHDYANAEKSLRNSVDILAACPKAQPALEANACQQLYTVLRAQYRVNDAGNAYFNAIAAFERWKNAEAHAGSRSEIGMVLAQTHLFQCNYLPALKEIDDALERLPKAPRYLVLRATLLTFRANCEFGLGQARPALEAAETADIIQPDPLVPARPAAPTHSNGSSPWEPP